VENLGFLMVYRTLGFGGELFEKCGKKVIF
jgi:hypothetical protein